LAIFFEKKTFKPKYVGSSTWRKVFLINGNKLHKTKEKIIFDRSSTVPLTFIGIKTRIYNGKIFHKKLINKWMVGFKFGEFTWNRKVALFKSKQTKKNK